jgi:hypothetical protein
VRYCFDLDGTLCTAEYPDYTIAEPFRDRITVVNELYAAGHHITINTARGSGTGEDWRWRTMVQLEGWGLRYHELRVGDKPFADIYVDDRGQSPDEFFAGLVP